ncbi:MAG: hypothetical protein O2913_07880 [Chloroflexi bacterium]|nr:hypothetical protein [Chloroflexota bacterium]
MIPTPLARRLPGLPIAGIIMALALILAACGGGSPTESPTESPTATLATPQITPPSITPGSTLPPTADPSSPLALQLLSPKDGVGVEVGAVRVMGRTRIDAAVAINGTRVEVFADGSFYLDVVLENGANSVEVIASTLSDEAVSQEATVYFIATAAGLPFTLFYPPDGLTVADPNIPVFGVTSVEAVVGVDGSPVDVNSLGVFSGSVTLEDGANSIEVLSTDIDGNVRFQTVGVFYIP